MASQQKTVRPPKKIAASYNAYVNGVVTMNKLIFAGVFILSLGVHAREPKKMDCEITMDHNSTPHGKWSLTLQERGERIYLFGCDEGYIPVRARNHYLYVYFSSYEVNKQNLFIGSQYIDYDNNNALYDTPSFSVNPDFPFKMNIELRGGDHRNLSFDCKPHH